MCPRVLALHPNPTKWLIFNADQGVISFEHPGTLKLERTPCIAKQCSHLWLRNNSNSGLAKQPWGVSGGPLETRTIYLGHLYIYIYIFSLVFFWIPLFSLLCCCSAFFCFYASLFFLLLYFSAFLLFRFFFTSLYFCFSVFFASTLLCLLLCLFASLFFCLSVFLSFVSLFFVLCCVFFLHSLLFVFLLASLLFCLITSAAITTWREQHQQHKQQEQ